MESCITTILYLLQTVTDLMGPFAKADKILTRVAAPDGGIDGGLHNCILTIIPCCLQAPVRNWAWQPDDYFQTPAITPGQCEEQQLWDLPESFFSDGWQDYRCIFPLSARPLR